MTVRDKLGEFVLTAEAFNRYEAFAKDAANYCWLDEDDPDATHAGGFEMKLTPGESNERRVLVRADHVYGARRPIAQAIFDVACGDSSWTTAVWVGGAAPVSPGLFQWRIGVVVTPVLDEFDPSDTSWDDAYVTGGGLAFGASATCELMRLDGVLQCSPNNFPGPNLEPPEAQSDLELSGYWPGLLVVKGIDRELSWNEEEAIYGFELRVTTWAESTTPSSASWSGAVSNANSVCYVIRQ